MKKLEILLVIALSWGLGIYTNDCTFAVFMTVFSIPMLCEKKNKRRVKYE